MALVHTPPVRRAVLRRAIVTLQDRTGIVLFADRLSYNVAALRVTLTNVKAAAEETPNLPFLHTDTVSVSLPWSALLGPFRLGSVLLDNARVYIVRREDGTTNLPRTNSDATGSGAVPVGRLAVAQLAIEMADAVSGFALSLPALTVDVGPDDGIVELTRRGFVSQAGTSTQITKLRGGMWFDGRAVHLNRISLQADDASMTADGTLEILVDEPSIELQVSGDGDLRRLARWSVDEPRPRGAVAFQGKVSGSFSDPTASFDLEAPTIEWAALAASDVSASLRGNSARVDVASLNGHIAAGTVELSGAFTFATRQIDARARWKDVDAAQLTGMLNATTRIRPSGHASGTATLTGTGFDVSDLVLTASNTMQAGPLQRNRLPAAGTVDLDLDLGQWRLAATQLIAGVPLRADLRGRLNADRFAGSSVSGVLRIGTVSLPTTFAMLTSAGVLDPPTVASGIATGTVRLAGRLDAPDLRTTVNVGELAVGEVKNLAIDLTAAGTPHRQSIDVRVRQSTGNVGAASGTVWPMRQRLDIQATGRIVNPGSLAPGLSLEGPIDLAFAGQGPFDTIQGRGTASADALTYEGISIGAAQATIELTESSARIEGLLTDFNARAAGDIARAAPHLATIRIEAAETDLARLARPFQPEAPLAGTVTINAEAAGPLDEWRRASGVVHVVRLDARTGELPIRLVAPARAEYRDGVADISTLEATIGETRLSIAGRIPVLQDAEQVPPAEALRATLTGDVAQALSAVRAAALVDLPPVTGRGPIALLARVTGSAQALELAADLEVGPGSVQFGDLPEVSHLELRAHLKNGLLQLARAGGEWQKSQLTADGHVPLRLLEPYLPRALQEALPRTTGPAALNARATGLTPFVLAPFLDADTLSELEGAVDASLRLTASSLKLEDLEGEVRLDRLDIRVAGLPVTQREPTRIVADRGFARVATWDWVGEGATLTVRGQVRLEDRQSAILANGYIDLRTLTPFLRDAGVTTAGIVEPRLSITGPVTDPRIDGDIRLAGGELRLQAPRVVATDISARAVLSKTTAQITSLTGAVNGGSLTGNGRADFSAGALRAQLTAAIRSMAMNAPEGLRSEVNADVTIDLARQDDEALGGAVMGTVTVLRGAYREPLALTAGLFGAIRAQQLGASPADEDSLLKRLRLDVRVVTDEDIAVDNNIGRLQLHGDLRLIGTAAAPSLSGRAELRPEGRLFLGRNIYTIELGAIDFANPSFIEPILDITAATRAGGEDVTIEITGTPDSPNVELSSGNPDLTQADLGALLATGRTLDQLGDADAEFVGRELVLGNLSGEILGFAGRAAGLDSIRLGGVAPSAVRRDSTAAASEIDPTSRLTFGKTLGRNVELTFSQSLIESDAQTWIVDYMPLRQLELRVVSGDDDLRSYEFRHDVSFGGVRRARAEAAPAKPRETRVGEVTFSGEIGDMESRLRKVVRLGVDDRFDFVEWQQDRDRLEQYYEDQGFREVRVAARRDDTTGVVALGYEITPGPRTSIEVSGYQLSRETTAALEHAWSDSVFDGFLIEEAVDIVRSALAADGHLEAKVNASITKGETKRLQIAVEPGARAIEQRVRVEGPDTSLNDGVNAWLASRGLDDERARDPGFLERQVTAYLRGLGYLQARVTAGAVAVEGSVATLPLSVEGGAIFTVADVVVRRSYTLEDSDGTTRGLAAGTPYDPAAVDMVRDRLTSAYRRAGFSQVGVTARPEIRDARVTVNFDVVEGPRQVLREVIVDGSRSIDADVVLRALDLPMGEPLSPDAWLQARRRVFDTGLFRRVDIATEALPALGDGEQPVRLRISVEEWPALRLRYGFQVAEERPETEIEGRDVSPGLTVDLSRRTLFGRAITLGLAGEYQRREQEARTFVTAPSLLALPIESSLSLGWTRRPIGGTDLIDERTSVSGEQRIPIAEHLRLSYGLQLERSRTQSGGGLIGGSTLEVQTSRLTVAGVWDTRDDPTNATFGTLVSSSLEYAPEALGSDIRFARFVNQAYHFRPWRDLVFASAGRFGVVRPFGGQDLLSSERFFTGGARTVRGAPEEGLGPGDFFGPIGGEALLVLNQEVRFPLYRWVRGVAFVDAGNVFPRLEETSFGSLAGSGGFGVRVTTPFGILRGDYGRLWSPEPDQPAGRFTFGLGQTF